MKGQCITTERGGTEKNPDTEDSDKAMIYPDKLVIFKKIINKNQCKSVSKNFRSSVPIDSGFFLWYCKQLENNTFTEDNEAL
jgi:hypothetical protein